MPSPLLAEGIILAIQTLVELAKVNGVPKEKIMEQVEANFAKVETKPADLLPDA